MILTNHAYGWYWPEFAHPYLQFQAAGWEIDVASCAGGKTTCDPSSINAEEIEADPAEKSLFGQLEEMSMTKELASLKMEDYQLLFAVGGFGAMWDFPMSTALANAARQVYEQGATISGVCHGPIFLANVKLSDGSFLIAGKEFTAFSDEEENFIETNYKVGKLAVMPLHEGRFRTCHEVLGARGGIGSSSSEGVFKPNVVCTDPRLVTGQNPASARPLGQKLVALLS